MSWETVPSWLARMDCAFAALANDVNAATAKILFKGDLRNGKPRNALRARKRH
jgi:hypothetical protein